MVFERDDSNYCTQDQSRMEILKDHMKKKIGNGVFGEIFGDDKMVVKK